MNTLCTIIYFEKFATLNQRETSEVLGVCQGLGHPLSTFRSPI